jgi:carnitine O-acetyltransferase
MSVFEALTACSSPNAIHLQDYKTLSFPTPNVSILDSIHSAAFTVSLDTSKPSTPIEHSRDLWHGSLPSPQNPTVGLRNRWCDKPVQFIIFDNARAGIMGEHSVMDGTPTVTLCNDLLDMLADKSFDHGSRSSDTARTALPKPLDWTVTKEIEHAIKVADKAALELCSGQTMSYYLTPYGKAAIKKFGVSPDSWAQMIMQLAYARLLTSTSRSATFTPKLRSGGTYEAASTRRYFKGRTEAIRVVSEESDKWVNSMMDKNVERAERKALFAKAVKKHVGDAKEGGMGNGVDRHLLGKCLYFNCHCVLFISPSIQV